MNVFASASPYPSRCTSDSVLIIAVLLGEGGGGGVNAVFTQTSASVLLKLKLVRWIVMKLSVALFGDRAFMANIAVTTQPGRTRSYGCRNVGLEGPAKYVICLFVVIFNLVYAPVYTLVSCLVCRTVVFCQFLHALQ